MAAELNGCSVAVLATDGVEQVELQQPVQALRDAGAQVQVISPKSGTLQGFNHLDKGDAITVDLPLTQADPAKYQALLLPGGVANPDLLRLEPKAIEFVRHFVHTDQGLVTSRKPDDIPAFNRKMIEEFREGVHRKRAAA